MLDFTVACLKGETTSYLIFSIYRQNKINQLSMKQLISGVENRENVVHMYSWKIDFNGNIFKTIPQ